MDIRDRKGLKQQAAAALEAAPHKKKIIALYTGVSLGLSVLLVLADLLLSSMIEKTSGLSNMGSRIILQTIQGVLPVAQAVFLLVWQYGYLGTVMGMSRLRMADHRELHHGFRILGPIVRLTMLQYGIAFVLSFSCMYLSALIFTLSPFARPIMDTVAAIIGDTAMTQEALMMDPGVIAAVENAVVPVMVIFLIIACVLVLPVTFLFRMAGYCLLDDPRAGALAALRNSRAMMRSNRLKLLMLDLSFWWYYLLSMAAMAICYGDSLLALVGITLPFGETGNYLLFYGLYLIAQFAYCYFFQNYVEVTYVKAYEALKPDPQEGGVVLGNIFQM